MDTIKDSSLALIVKMATTAWETQNTRVNKLLQELSDDQWKAQIAPGKNTGVYLLGHLTAVNDALFPLFGFGEKLHPELEEIFLRNPDNSDLKKPEWATLKNYWNEVNAKLSQHIKDLKPEEWLNRHQSVSEEDFAKEPHRNMLSVLLNRTTHQGYHVGQLVLLKK